MKTLLLTMLLAVNAFAGQATVLFFGAPIWCTQCTSKLVDLDEALDSEFPGGQVRGIAYMESGPTAGSQPDEETNAYYKSHEAISFFDIRSDWSPNIPHKVWRKYYGTGPVYLPGVVVLGGASPKVFPIGQFSTLQVLLEVDKIVNPYYRR